MTVTPEGARISSQNAVLHPRKEAPQNIPLRHEPQKLLKTQKAEIGSSAEPGVFPPRRSTGHRMEEIFFTEANSEP